MTLKEQSLIAGHAEFHHRCRAALSNLRTAELLNLGERPECVDIENPTNEETTLLLAYSEKEKKTNKAMSVMKNSSRMEANDFYSQVMSNLVNNNDVSSITGVTDKNIVSKIALITDSKIEKSVLVIFNTF